MECSGISKLWQAVYSTDTLIHILSRKTNARALRFHFLAQFLLRLILLQLISLLSLMEELTACMFMKNTYMLQEANMENSFQINYQNTLMQVMSRCCVFQFKIFDNTKSQYLEMKLIWQFIMRQKNVKNTHPTPNNAILKTIYLVCHYH